jgi:CheY-like chemotaxis protein
MSGLEVLKGIRNTPIISRTKVIIFTNLDANPKLLSEVSALNPCFFINKENLRLEDLSGKIHECIG